MSKVFWDHFVAIEEIDVYVKEIVESEKERNKLWKRIDELLHVRILTAIFDNLPFNHHHDFLDRFHSSPYDEKLIEYLDEKIEASVEKIVKREVEEVKKDLLEITSKD
jgi:hypothetical protein